MFRAVSCLFAGLALTLSIAASGQTISQGGIRISNQGSGSVTMEEPGSPTQECTAQSPFGCFTSAVPNSPSDVFTFTANPAAGWQFVEWQSGNGPVETSPVITRGPFVSAVPSESITAVFEVIPDADGDGVNDNLDQCPNTPTGSSVDSVGCAQSELDDDNDGVTNDADQCPNTPTGASVNASGCAQSELDDDNDGVTNDADQCPNTPTGASVNASGCAQSELDDDNDGVTNDADQCPVTPTGASVNASGCAQSELDDDNDGVTNDADQCPNTPTGASVNASGCAQSELDNDNDGVTNDADQCPNTPIGESVNGSGCAQSQLDSDRDGVVNSLDVCPATPFAERADQQGCSDSQRDSDRDGVNDALDQCPDTPLGASVDNDGCADSQKDTDVDGVTDDVDQCPETGPGEAVDAEGCADNQKDTDADGVTDDVDLCPDTPPNDDPNSEGCGASQRDTDGDGVNDALDLCPATVPGEAVDEDGCADTQKDSDNDGVNDALDQCPNTQAGEAVDENGCSQGQRDDDGDGIANAFDECAATVSDKPVNEAGCSVVQEQLAELGDDLAGLDGLAEDDKGLAGAIDDACPRLIIAGDEQALTAGQEDLRIACSNLKSLDSTSEQQLAALASISPQLLTNRTDAVIETASRQFQQVTQRLNRIKGGGSRGVSLAGLTLNFAGEAVPGALLEEAADQAGASELGPDFGNWGIYIQGDIDVTERRDTDSRRQYDEDAFLLSVGADYRFNADLYAGLAVSFGETETDYADAQSDTETTALTLYGGWQFSESGFLDVQLGWADDDYEMSRAVEYRDAGGAFTSAYRGMTGGSHMTAAANLGYMLNVKGWRVGPTASYFYLDGEVDAYHEDASEGSSQAWELAVGESRFEKSVLRLGLQVDYAWLTDFGVVIPGFMLHYVDESNRGDAVTTTRLANDIDSFAQLIDIDREILDGQYWDASFSIAGQFAYGFSGFASYRITGARDGYQHRGYTLGLRWDQAF